MIWYVFMWVFVALVAATVGTTTFVLAKHEFNGWLCLISWVAAIILAITGVFLSNRALSGEVKFVFETWGEAILWAAAVALRFVMFFTNENERIKKE